jgi:DNA-binding transcriptional ArsR family regulator
MSIYFIKSVAQLLSLSSPGRDDIVDAVGLIGPCSVPELARHLGRPYHALYYHIKALRDCGVLIENQRKTTRRKRTAVYDVPGRPLSIRYGLATKRERQAVAKLAQIRLRSATRGFIRACRPDVAVTHGLKRNLWVARWKGWISETELKEVNRLLFKILGKFRHGGAERVRRRPHEFTFALAPVQARIAYLEGAAKQRPRRTQSVSGRNKR